MPLYSYKFVALFCVFCTSFISPAVWSQSVNETTDDKMISWLNKNRADEKNARGILRAERFFFQHWPVERLNELQFYEDKTLALPATWRLTQQNILAASDSASQELGYFFGFLLGKCNAVAVDVSFREVMQNLSVDRQAKSEFLIIKQTQGYLRNLEFDLKVDDNVFEGKYPQVEGIQESQPGHLRRLKNGNMVWSTEIPVVHATTIPWGGARKVSPRIATVFASTESVFCMTVFHRYGIYLHEFDLETGGLLRIYVFAFSIDEDDSQEKLHGK